MDQDGPENGTEAVLVDRATGRQKPLNRGVRVSQLNEIEVIRSNC